MTIIWSMVPEIWSVIDKILCHFGPFCPFTPPSKSQKIKFWKNEKNTWRYYHFTHVYHNDNHMMYGSWDIKCNRQNFLSFRTIFCPFTPLQTRKTKILKKRENKNKNKNPGDIIILHKCIKKSWSYVALFLR